ncbi:uncharacterized protein [Aristolochia californica]|uniref:uncharacterized protein n=1 Tax=Aristolochia californica TaxID=171875 RepID=UPI0035D8D079
MDLKPFLGRDSPLLLRHFRLLMLYLFLNSPKKQVISGGHEQGGLYFIDLSPVTAFSTSQTEAQLWHNRFGHLSLSKYHRTIYSPRAKLKGVAMFSLIHSDVWGPLSVSNIFQFKYFIIFVDDFTRIESFSPFVRIMALSIRPHVHTPQQNSVAKIKNWHLLEFAHGLFYSMNVPYFYSPHAIFTAYFLINRLPSSVLGHKSHIPSYFHIRTFFPSFEDKSFYSSKEVHLGLSFVLVAPKPSMPVDADISIQPPKALANTTHVEFTDPSKVSPSSTLVFGQPFDTRPIALLKEPGTSTRSSTLHPISNFVSHHRLSSSCCQFFVSISFVFIPQSYQEALRDPGQKAVIEEKMKALYEN